MFIALYSMDINDFSKANLEMIKALELCELEFKNQFEDIAYIFREEYSPKKIYQIRRLVEIRSI